ncbi:hypothetical protein M9434_007162 [Picochlorum sp. BPE23]|nr:hypothetical protein M9434_007162 [Picochlorum sp. BPE23]
MNASVLFSGCFKTTCKPVVVVAANPNRKGGELAERHRKSSSTPEKDGALARQVERAAQVGTQDDEHRGPAVLGVLQCSDAGIERDVGTKMQWSDWAAEDLLTG